MAKGRRSGSRNFSRQAFTESRLKGIMYGIRDAVQKGAAVSLEELAPEFLRYVATSEPEFNDYTGNLVNAYAATLFVKRKYVKTFFHETGKRGIIKRGPKGGRYAFLQKPLRHYEGRRRKMLVEREGGMAGFRSVYKYREYFNYKDRQIRYLKKWEKLGGYRRRSAMKGVNYSARGFGSAYAQNFLRIENQAPYAEMVQQGRGGAHKHYRVLRGANVARMTSRATELTKMVTLQELKKAGFKVR